jgi:thiamine kinase-like enzyme
MTGERQSSNASSGTYPFSTLTFPARRRQIVRLYERLHHAGVLHRDCVPRHWLRDGYGKIRLIDFDRSVAYDLALMSQDEWDRHFESEMTLVRDQLWHGAVVM